MRAELEGGRLRPVYLLLGEESFLIEESLKALRARAAEGGIAGFNEDKFTAPDARIDAVIAAAKTLPMMARTRTVIVRALDRWEQRDGDAKGKGPLDDLADYAKEPADTAVVILTAQKLNGQRKLVSLGKKEGFLVACDPLHRRDLPRFVTERARLLGHEISRASADRLAELVGPELGAVNDAVDRLSLYVGEGKPIDDDAIHAVITRIREASIWELVDALAARNLEKALLTLRQLDVPRDEEVRLLGAIGYSVRQLVKFDAHLRRGTPTESAAREAGVPPFKAESSRAALKKLGTRTLVRWVELLAEADLALKRSRRPGHNVFEALVIDMCAR